MMASASTRILDNNLQLLFSTNHRTTYSRPCLFKADSIKNSILTTLKLIPNQSHFIPGPALCMKYSLCAEGRLPILVH
ncbi:hypothetical protein TIFTF001_048094, partial [Ficus carica]